MPYATREYRKGRSENYDLEFTWNLQVALLMNLAGAEVSASLQHPRSLSLIVSIFDDCFEILLELDLATCSQTSYHYSATWVVIWLNITDLFVKQCSSRSDSTYWVAVDVPLWEIDWTLRLVCLVSQSQGLIVSLWVRYEASYLLSYIFVIIYLVGILHLLFKYHNIHYLLPAIQDT